MKYLLFLLFIPSISFGSIIAGSSYNGIANDSQVLMLAHCEGNDDGQVFIDTSGRHTLAAVNHSSTTIDQVKFGLTSCYVDGADWVTIADNLTDLVMANSFTIEGWTYITTQGDGKGWMSTDLGASNIGWALGASNDTSKHYSCWDNAAWQNSSTDITLNAWVHWAFVRNTEASSKCDLYVNGVSVKSFIKTGNIGCSNAGASFGGVWTNDYAAAYAIAGYIDEIRISKVARWTHNFTVPNRAY